MTIMLTVYEISGCGYNTLLKLEICISSLIITCSLRYLLSLYLLILLHIEIPHIGDVNT